MSLFRNIPKLARNYLIQINSLVIIVITLCSASVEDLKTVLSFPIHQDIIEPLMVTKYPVSDLRVMGYARQFKSQNP